MRFLRVSITLISCLLVTVISGREVSGKDGTKEEGVFKIYVEGREIGNERFALATHGDSASSTSVVNFRNPADGSQKIELESQLDMDGNFRPRNYQLTSNVEGKRGTITGLFSERTAMFEYSGGGTSRKSGVLVGKDYTVLDTNVFHHFLFIVRLFKFDSGEKTQRFEVVVPQEGESGFLKISKVGNEILSVAGKKTETDRLQVDSGSLAIQLWTDKKHKLQKIAVPALRIEVIRT